MASAADKFPSSEGFQPFIIKAGLAILNELKDPKNFIASFIGYGGLGKSRTAKYVADTGLRTGQFSRVVWVTVGRDISEWNLQVSIAEQLAIKLDSVVRGGSQRMHQLTIASMIYESLAAQKFLLVLDNLLDEKYINLENLGIPRRNQWHECRVLITTPFPRVCFAMRSDVVLAFSLPKDKEVNEKIKYVIIHLMRPADLFLNEARDMADSLRMRMAPIPITPAHVFNCFRFLCSFLKRDVSSKEELLKYYVGEGLIPCQQSQNSVVGEEAFEAALEAGEALLLELLDRCVIEISSHGRISVTRQLSETTYLTDYPMFKVGSSLQDIEEQRREAVERISLSGDEVFIMRCDPCPNWPNLACLLLNDNYQLKSIPDSFFKRMPSLRVLDLSRTGISCLPPSVTCLSNLRLLKLQQCQELTTLPQSFEGLGKLLMLDLHGTPLTKIPEESLKCLWNLRLLDLSETNIDALPLSLACLGNLEQLLLTGCRSWTWISSSEGPKRLLALQFSNASSFPRPEPLRANEGTLCLHLPKLRVLSLWSPRITRISLSGCPWLRTLHLDGLTDLRSLSVSGTMIKEFPHEISKLTRLERLDLLEMKHLKNVEWDEIEWLPKELNWDECACSDRLSKYQDRDVSKAFISVSNSQIFRNLSPFSPLWKTGFSKFHFLISPCTKQRKENQVVAALEGKKPSPYSTMYSKTKTLGSFSRHLEIEGIESLEGSVATIIQQAELLSLRDNGFLTSLTDLSLEIMENLKECRVQRCHNMEYIFDSVGIYISGMEKFWISDLSKLTKMHNRYEWHCENLKHLYLECCPKLVSVFPGDTYFDCLEMLEIKFCARLEYPIRDDVQEVFPRLRSLQLWELPKLYSICDSSLPALDKMTVRGCPKLLRLPRFNGEHRTVEIEGEAEWWESVERDNHEGLDMLQHINFTSAHRFITKKDGK